MNILVIGGGVSGLTTALRLLEAQHNVVIWTKARAADTTSAVAAATWFPYAVAGANANQWGVESYDIFAHELATATEETGVALRPLLFLQRQPQAHSIPWLSQVNARDLSHDERPQDPETGITYKTGFTFDSPVIDMSRYLSYLERRVTDAGGRIAVVSVRDWRQAFAGWASLFTEGAAQPQVIVNCAGLGARELAPEDANDSSDGLGVRPARGQVVRIEPNGFDRVLLDESDGLPPTYVVPRIRDIVLGGTYEVGKELRAVDLATRADILTRCATLLLTYDERFAMSLAALVGGETAARFKEMVSAEFADTPAARLSPLGAPDDCGLRPIRAEVALKRQKLGANRYVIHNYGHGGGGVTLSWGCAREVVELVAAL